MNFLKFIVLFFQYFYQKLFKISKLPKLKQCGAFNLNYETCEYTDRCSVLSTNNFCDDHRKLMTYECREYHHTRRMAKYTENMHYWARVELNARRVFQ